MAYVSGSSIRKLVSARILRGETKNKSEGVSLKDQQIPRVEGEGRGGVLTVVDDSNKAQKKKKINKKIGQLCYWKE